MTVLYRLSLQNTLIAGPLPDVDLPKLTYCDFNSSYDSGMKAVIRDPTCKGLIGARTSAIVPAVGGYCWQAHTQDYLGYYASVGYTCVGGYCSAINPLGTLSSSVCNQYSFFGFFGPQVGTCAKFVPRADAVDPLTGK